MDELHKADQAQFWLFTGVSVRNGLVGTGLVIGVNQNNIAMSHQPVGKDDALNAPLRAVQGGVRSYLVCRVGPPSYPDVTMENMDYDCHE
ncbi:hypothetical protein N7467_001864 [Penicillium canescens]|nr:hypothetical protein N7467_001864 [Penicillium canescens]